MAVYPNIELTYQYLNSNMNMLRVELDQPYPRLIKNNMIFYKIKKLVCGPFNTGIVSEEGDLLLMGSNDGGQLAMGDDIGSMVPFFPEFRKIDTFGRDLKVFDVALGAVSSHILARDQHGNSRMFAIGDNEYGQLGNGTNLATQNVLEVQCPVQFEQIASGAWHVLALDSQGKLYGWGKLGNG